VPVAAQLYVHANDSSVRLALHVQNTGKKRVELTFPSGQTYDFVILDTLGREVWRWGNGRMFTQALRNKSLGGGETLDLEETWKASSLPPGRYTARALLTSENYPLVEQTEFTVTGTTVASR
jgi:Intracellular proteinase inhibitor